MTGEKKAKTARFVTTRGDDRTLDEASLARAQSLIGLKGYVTNVPVTVMPAAEVIAKYHDLWHVEKSFRMSKSDLATRPMFNRMRDAIEAHLTIAFAALAVSHAVQSRTGLSIAKVAKLLRPLRSATININGATQTFPPAIPDSETKSSPISASTLGTKQNVQTQVRSSASSTAAASSNPSRRWRCSIATAECWPRRLCPTEPTSRESCRRPARHFWSAATKAAPTSTVTHPTLDSRL